ncbi:hypothetical protein BAUCODRAFT_128099 [Baudoinia panamericana UAMH 10762]|uniref:Uncharacterized protein n=1 Tax=Baudoinia panamericana (strain UAMH 10762) TaxID=717646 RepID=M2NNL8_BAUPA|nr:uncharacterized protein BAUCODRAFT_128099 [Baudoinia panamericana UAMH 10762]EMD01105.1 hypothetical protein BAUCODRAFT_128099 [Baudoinia panamericana UAMH 10762]
MGSVAQLPSPSVDLHNIPDLCDRIPAKDPLATSAAMASYGFGDYGSYGDPMIPMDDFDVPNGHTLIGHIHWTSMTFRLSMNHGNLQPFESQSELVGWGDDMDSIFASQRDQTLWSRTRGSGRRMIHDETPYDHDPNYDPHGRLGEQWGMPSGEEFGMLQLSTGTSDGRLSNHRLNDGYPRLPHGFYLSGRTTIPDVSGASRVESTGRGAIRET